MEETIEKQDFHIDSESSAAWLLRKLRTLAEEKAAVQAATAQRIAELVADENRLMGRFGAELEAWARQQAEERHRKTITVPLAGCAVAFRTVPARLELTEEAVEIAATLGMMKPATPDTVAYRKHAEQVLKDTGEILPGVSLREAEERFSIRLPKGTEAEE